MHVMFRLVGGMHPPHPPPKSATGGAAFYRYSKKSSVAAATCMQNSGLCRYFNKIFSKKNDGFQIRYLTVKFQLYFRKLIIQAFKISVQVTIDISRIKWLTGKQITIPLVVAMLRSKKQAFQNVGWSNQRFRNYSKKLPFEVKLGS